MKKLHVFTIICLVLAGCASASFINVPAQNEPIASSPTVPMLQTDTPSPVSDTPTATALPQSAAPATKTSIPNFDHIVLIMLENRDYTSVIGSNQMPLLNALASKNVLLSNYFAVTHPSLPNYIALMSGSTQNITSDCKNCFVNQPNLADRIEASGRTWKSYLESMPSPCFLGDADPYAQKHNPLLYFDSIRLDPTRCNRSIVPLTSLDGDLANNQLPNFSFIMPNLCNSGHNCSGDFADKWVSDMVAKLQASPALGKNSLIMIAFDEGSEKNTSSCCGMGSQAGGQVAVVLISPSAIPGFNDSTPYSHYSLLKTILTAWNLPALGQTAQADTQPIEAPWTGKLGHTTSASRGSSVSVPSTKATSDAAPVKVDEASCSSSSPVSAAYTAKVCFANLSNGGTLSGDVTVTATVRITGTSPGVQNVVFYLDGTYLLTGYSRPYNFTLPTEKWVDGNHTLSVEAKLRDKFTTQQGNLSVVFKNGVTALPVNSNHFKPTTGTLPANGSPFIVAAGGDGAGGEPNATKVSDLIASLNPNLFLYLGDVYENGSMAEFYNWYGTSSTFFGRFRSITDPTVGNHEYLTPGASGYFDYWNNIPNYYSYNAGGWHFVSLNSNSPKIGVDTQSTQYQWLQHDLAANAQSCTIVYYHHPLFNIGPEGPTSALSSIWALMAQYGVSIVLNGHDHDYQRWVPLDGTGQPSASGITEFVVGSAGHGIQKSINSDSRVAYSNDTSPAAFGVLLLQLDQNSATFSYQSTTGSILDSGVIPCVHASSYIQPSIVSTEVPESTGNRMVYFTNQEVLPSLSTQNIYHQEYEL